MHRSGGGSRNDCMSTDYDISSKKDNSSSNNDDNCKSYGDHGSNVGKMGRAKAKEPSWPQPEADGTPPRLGPEHARRDEAASANGHHDVGPWPRLRSALPA